MHVEALKKFWPTGCAHWHALANVSAPERRPGGVLWAGQELRQRDAQGLAGELRRGVASRLQIAKAQTSTQGRIGCPLGAEPWTGALYQNANRLAYLYWLESRGVRTWLVHPLFTRDPHGPTTRTEWEDATRLDDERMGLTGLSVRHVCLEAGTCEELIA